jgi:hypothetical protein
MNHKSISGYDNSLFINVFSLINNDILLERERERERERWAGKPQSALPIASSRANIHITKSLSNLSLLRIQGNPLFINPPSFGKNNTHGTGTGTVLYERFRACAYALSNQNRSAAAPAPETNQGGKPDTGRMNLSKFLAIKY